MLHSYISRCLMATCCYTKLKCHSQKGACQWLLFSLRLPFFNEYLFSIDIFKYVFFLAKRIIIKVDEIAIKHDGFKTWIPFYIQVSHKGYIHVFQQELTRFYR